MLRLPDVAPRLDTAGEARVPLLDRICTRATGTSPLPAFGVARCLTVAERASAGLLDVG